MSYEKLTIKQVIEKIGNNEIYLPAIQRKFVWKQEQTEKLFDSIQQGYPIGTFLLWFVKRPHIDNYVFYKFLQNYHQRDNYLNIRIPNPELKDEIIGVLDGQQRLSSIYLALQGTYSTKRPYYSWNNDAAFPQKILHLNLLSEIHAEEDNEFNFSFQFITEEESNQKNENSLWFSIREVLTWDKDSPPIDEFYDRIQNENGSIPTVAKKLADISIRNRIKRTIRDLHSRLVREEIINYFKIEEQELDNILKIFVRVNSGGTILSKTDLLFSTIVANWENGRDEIEQFIITINKFGEGFSFNNDFVMRNCLMLTDCDVLFKVGSFKTENVLMIKSSWPKIKSAILKTVEIITDFGFNGSTLPSQNAIIPVAYYIIKGGIVNNETKAEIKKFLFHSLLKNIFSGQGDTILTNLRNALRSKDSISGVYHLQSTNFKYSELSEVSLPSGKSLKITDNDIEDFLEVRKSNTSFLILSFLYPNLKYSQVKFHQDHIHPDSQFVISKFKAANVQPEDYIKFQAMKDKLPNLQILEGIENIKKNSAPFKDWLNSKDDAGQPLVPDKEKFLLDNYISKDQSLEFADFLAFYEARKTNLRNELLNLLK